MSSNNAKLQGVITKAIVDFFAKEDLCTDELKIQGTIVVTADRCSFFITQLSEIIGDDISSQDLIFHRRPPLQALHGESNRSVNVLNQERNRNGLDPSRAGPLYRTNPIIHPGAKSIHAVEKRPLVLPVPTTEGPMQVTTCSNNPSATSSQNSSDVHSSELSGRESIRQNPVTESEQDLNSKSHATEGDPPSKKRPKLEENVEERDVGPSEEDDANSRGEDDTPNVLKDIMDEQQSGSEEKSPTESKEPTEQDFLMIKQEPQEEEDDSNPHTVSHFLPPTFQGSEHYPGMIPPDFQGQHLPSNPSMEGAAVDFSNYAAYGDSMYSFLRRAPVRTKYSQEQITLLEEMYRLDPFLSTSAGRRAELARKLNLTEKNIQIWFQNKRRRSKFPPYQGPTQSMPGTLTSPHYPPLFARLDESGSAEGRVPEEGRLGQGEDNSQGSDRGAIWEGQGANDLRSRQLNIEVGSGKQ